MFLYALYITTKTNTVLRRVALGIEPLDVVCALEKIQRIKYLLLYKFDIQD